MYRVGAQPTEDGEQASRELRIQFGRALRAARREAGLTQVQMAQRLGLTQQYISLVERGQENLTLETMSNLTRVIGAELKVTIEMPPRRQP
jgi:HTH-type transcriptional regulator/antitoxin HipB